MLKWVAGLCAAIYATLLVFGAPPEGNDMVAEKPPSVPIATRFVAVEPASDPQPDPLEITPKPVAKTATQPMVAVTALPNQSQTEDATAKVEKPEPLIARNPNGIGEIWRVTGSRVNLRKAATTRASVIGQTRKGDRAEVLELLESGWARVLIIESGVEAYMSAQYIAREG
ncbi:MAG: SH3 domain-containing protein [Pseudomonadota bacterium]